ncbi:hypothetical protein SASPL_132698 [Salvia splendens]|uniref:Uncharacterized protein n=1 Tax=Salvia splendens TaxID=180675 RepID=A0A8X8ZHL9_SALSN|nr:uncharacterized protein LOC121757955 [Salvia splendens]KAG6405116.1 hypothetical protein SASPL_132698 [Salvia splendens]
MTAMKNTIRCCISCILPCGALDVIRIVHTNGRVEEISGGAVTAAEIMKLHPKHVLKKPSTAADGMCPKITVVPPDAELRRGKIYFLMPLPPQPQPKRKKSEGSRSGKIASKTAENNNSVAELLVSDRYLSEILSEKVSSQRDRRRRRGRVWRPHLDSISEAASDA